MVKLISVWGLKISFFWRLLGLLTKAFISYLAFFELNIQRWYGCRVPGQATNITCNNTLPYCHLAVTWYDSSPNPVPLTLKLSGFTLLHASSSVETHVGIYMSHGLAQHKALNLKLTFKTNKQKNPIAQNLTSLNQEVGFIISL